MTDRRWRVLCADGLLCGEDMTEDEADLYAQALDGTPSPCGPHRVVHEGEAAMT